MHPITSVDGPNCSLAISEALLLKTAVSARMEVAGGESSLRVTESAE